ncbi:geranylgeranylglyceryl phosphate synthase family protein [Thermaerobacter marianensis DSM 12885]|uniref:Geranylgeranylglyceryl phosphate synthase family protein n=1 Tax=Thermaerobacter marianensis (strain ATCC 700841 / DSM 12885 / JCM 10246 / 7p75a) TaxID=644966 RepID=E6SMG8_THEM7|nr:heptaprenylglyceryl phosphate synthase [Thermaerobacter marianensis]ADU50428.1 geranylgeranylglyceryl phosphate synthase family protein [Thermaerobacter marianensis DSM 12885]
MDWRRWRHAVKLDPARPLDPEVVRGLATTGTDALILGGSDGIRREAVFHLLGAARATGLPVAIEVSSEEAVVPGADWYLIPMVLNTRDPRWLVGAHREAFQNLHRIAPGIPVPWDRVVTVAYVVCNPDATVARVAAAVPPAGPDEVAAWTTVAERLLRADIVYIEYSGRFGDPAWVGAAAGAMRGARLFYGGGIGTAEQAAVMAARAHTVVVGNALYRPGGLECIRATVEGARRVRPGEGGEPIAAGGRLP